MLNMGDRYKSIVKLVIELSLKVSFAGIILICVCHWLPSGIASLYQEITFRTVVDWLEVIFGVSVMIYCLIGRKKTGDGGSV